jgi:hypothetical protein
MRVLFLFTQTLLEVIYGGSVPLEGKNEVGNFIDVLRNSRDLLLQVFSIILQSVVEQLSVQP